MRFETPFLNSSAGVTGALEVAIAFMNLVTAVIVNNAIDSGAEEKENRREEDRRRREALSAVRARALTILLQVRTY